MSQEPNPIADWYVEWANTLDSAGRDSSPVRDRLTPEMVVHLQMVLFDAIHASKNTDNIKKHLYYGRELAKPVRESLGQQSDFVSSRARLNDHNVIRLLHGILGKIDEAGELAQALYAYVYHGQSLNWTNIVEEVGDSQWYDALIAKAANLSSFDPIQEANYRKLLARYPEAEWKQEHALNRDLDAEEKALEGGVDA